MDLVQRDNIFNQTSPIQVKRNAFDLTRKIIGAYDMGKLYPISIAEMYPGDHVKTQLQLKMIFNTMKFPIYQNLKANFYFFDVAYRNLWKHWRNYYTGGRKGNFTAQEPKVNLNCASNIKNSLFDYLGFPLQSQLKGDVYVSAFPFVAYDFIYFWNFINPELQENIVYNIQDKIGTTPQNWEALICSDELNKFVYYVDDFYLINDDGIPVYTRMLGGNGAAHVGHITYNKDLGPNDRYSYVPSDGYGFSIGVVYKDSTNNNELTSIKWDQTNKGTITNVQYRNAVNLGFLYNINWQRDYFTSAHLSQQQGSPSSIPLTSQVSGSGSVNIAPNFSQNVRVGSSGVSSAATVTRDKIGSQENRDYFGVYLNHDQIAGQTQFNTVPRDINFDVSLLNGHLTAASSSFTQNDFRLFWQIGMIKESVLFNKKNFEYASYLRFFFGRGPNTSDLQQPIFIGSSSLNIYVGEVVQTSETSATSPLGDRGGIASVTDKDFLDSYTFDEVSVMMACMYIAPSNIYQSSQGINRMWLRNDRFDYYNPLLSNIGLQEIQNRELYADGSDNDIEPFGYTPVFNELRYIPDTVVSDMRDTLDAWHMARKYSKLPQLNSDYILCRPTKRIYNVQMDDVPNITGIINIIQIAYRDMPELAIPQLLDHRY